MTDFEYMVEGMTKDLILILMERKNVTMPEALDMLFSSETYEKLSEAQSGLFFQSAGYVYDFLDKELAQKAS